MKRRHDEVERESDRGSAVDGHLLDYYDVRVHFKSAGAATGCPPKPGSVNVPGISVGSRVDVIAPSQPREELSSIRRTQESLGPRAARWAFSLFAAACVCSLVWMSLPKALSGSFTIVGYPIFADFAYQPAFWAYRLVAIAFPLLSVLLAAILGRYGPLRRQVCTVRAPVVGTAKWNANPRISAIDDAPDPPRVSGLGRAVRVALPAGVIVVAASARSGSVDDFAVFCGLIYLGALLVVVIGFRLAAPVPAHQSRSTMLGTLSLANGLGGATAAIIGLWFVSRYTFAFAPDGIEHWRWLPLWLAILGAAFVAGWTLWKYRNGTPFAKIEKTLLVTVVGSTLVFLTMSALPGPLGSLSGFDDAHELAGSALLSRGYFPWRDLLFVHGLYPDVLRGTISVAIFGDSRWGVTAGTMVLLIPLGWVFVYLFTAWVSRGKGSFLLVFGIAAFGGFLMPLDNRFILVPISLVLLGESLRRPTARWSVALSVLLFVQAVLIPETTFLAIPALSAVLAFEITRWRRADDNLWGALRRTRWCLATCVISVLALGAVLISQDSLQQFFDYFLVFGPGHNESGAIPPIGVEPLGYVFWGIGTVTVMITVFIAAADFARRRQWLPGMWVTLAAGAFLAFYQEKALGRFDVPHIAQGFTIVLPVVIIWLWTPLAAADRWNFRRPATHWSRAWRPSTVISLVVAALLVLASSTLWPNIQSLPGRHRMVTAQPVDTSYPRIGYAVIGAVDTGMLDDLKTVLDAYAGPDSPVFDMTNSLGYFYYLLGRDPGTRFAHVSMAIPPYAQDLLIGELEETKPPVVVFDSSQIGLPQWDGVANNVRHYKVSDYILDNWVPVLRTHGNLILVRKDLYQPGGTAPQLRQVPVTTDLYFSGQSCDWGDSPNFLTAEPAGDVRQFPVRRLDDQAILHARGWAADPRTGAPAKSLLVTAGNSVVAAIAPSVERPDVAAALGPAALNSGVDTTVSVSTTNNDADFIFYAQLPDGTVHPLAGASSPASSITMPSGDEAPVSDEAVGSLDDLTSFVVRVGEIEVPQGSELSGSDLITLSADGGPLGKSSITVTDSLTNPNHFIKSESLADTITPLSIRVGSCAQWKGYQPERPLYILQTGGSDVTSVSLSGIKPPD